MTGFDEMGVDFKGFGGRVKGRTGLECVSEGVVIVGERVGEHEIVEKESILWGG